MTEGSSSATLGAGADFCLGLGTVLFCLLVLMLRNPNSLFLFFLYCDSHAFNSRYFTSVCGTLSRREESLSSWRLSVLKLNCVTGKLIFFSIFWMVGIVVEVVIVV